MEEQEENGVYTHKESCPDCGSSDARAMYSNGTSYCFSCGVWHKDEEIKETPKEEPKQHEKEEISFAPVVAPKFKKIKFGALKARGISKETCEKFDYGVALGKHCCNYYDVNGKVVAQKFRSKTKDFGWIGEASKSVLFGQNSWKPHKKVKLVITEGEIDALSVSEIQDNKYPVVSLPNGAQSARRDIKRNLEWLKKFSEVILMFDSDEAGEKAAMEVQKLFPPKYCKIARLPLKDANEMLLAGRGKEVVNAIFDAEVYTPESIKNGADLLELLDQIDATEHYDFPEFLPNLTTKMRGMRLGDLTIITAGSGSGKTTFMKQLELHFHYSTGFNQGIIHLEENIRDTLEGMVSVALGRQLHLEDNAHKDPKVREKWAELVGAKDKLGNSKLNIIDAFGSLDTEALYDMIRFLAQVEECKIIYLDHITMLVSGMAGNIDERKALDNIMTALKSLTQELGIHIFVVSHLNNSTNGGKVFEEGGTPTVNNLRGSGGLKQLSDNIISLSRNQMAEDVIVRNTTLVSLLKCRKTGDTGITDRIMYQSSTGLFTQASEVQSEFNDTTKTQSDF